MTYDPDADAAYVYLTNESLSPGRDTTACVCPRGVSAMVNLDWKDGRIVGLEMLDASALLHADLLGSAGNGHMTHSFDPGRWFVQLESGGVVELRADGFSELDSWIVFTSLMDGDPAFSFEVARFPADDVNDVWGGPAVSPA